MLFCSWCLGIDQTRIISRLTIHVARVKKMYFHILVPVAVALSPGKSLCKPKKTNPMKITVLLIAVASAWSICAFSQAPGPLHVGIGTGWALPLGYHVKPGPLFYLEPTYRLSNNFTVGLRTEYVMMQRGTNEVYSYASPFNPSRRGGSSVTLNGQYFFSNGFVFGIGAGEDGSNETAVSEISADETGCAVWTGRRTAALAPARRYA